MSSIIYINLGDLFANTQEFANANVKKLKTTKADARVRPLSILLLRIFCLGCGVLFQSDDYFSSGVPFFKIRDSFRGLA